MLLFAFEMGNENFRPLFIVASLLMFLVNFEASMLGSGVDVVVGMMLESGDVSLMNDSESHVSDAPSVSLRQNSFSLSLDDDRAGVVCLETERLMSSPLALVVVSLLIMYTLEFSTNFPFSNVITLRTGEFCTNIFVLGMLLSLDVVT